MLTPKLIITGYNLLLFDTVPCYVIFLIYLMQALTIHRLSWSLSTKIIVLCTNFEVTKRSWYHMVSINIPTSQLTVMNAVSNFKCLKLLFKTYSIARSYCKIKSAKSKLIKWKIILKRWSHAAKSTFGDLKIGKLWNSQNLSYT